MQKVKVNIRITVKVDLDDEDSVREAVYDKLTESIECEELDFTVLGDEDEDEEELDY